MLDFQYWLVYGSGENLQQLSDRVATGTNLEILKLITSAENHFNNLTFNVRALASIWFLATIAGVGWILKDLPSSAVELKR
jgi:hypothetical protein